MQNAFAAILFGTTQDLPMVAGLGMNEFSASDQLTDKLAKLGPRGEETLRPAMNATRIAHVIFRAIPDDASPADAHPPKSSLADYFTRNNNGEP